MANYIIVDIVKYLMLLLLATHSLFIYFSLKYGESLRRRKNDNHHCQAFLYMHKLLLIQDKHC